MTSITKTSRLLLLAALLFLLVPNQAQAHIGPGAGFTLCAFTAGSCPLAAAQALAGENVRPASAPSLTESGQPHPGSW